LIKSNQKSSQQKCFFATHSLYPANQTEPRAAIICPASLPQSPASAKLAMPLPSHGPPLFCPLSAEAYLLTEEKICFINN